MGLHRQDGHGRVPHHRPGPPAHQAPGQLSRGTAAGRIRLRPTRRPVRAKVPYGHRGKHPTGAHRSFAAMPRRRGPGFSAPIAGALAPGLGRTLWPHAWQGWRPLIAARRHVANTRKLCPLAASRAGQSSRGPAYSIAEARAAGTSSCRCRCLWRGMPPTRRWLTWFTASLSLTANRPIPPWSRMCPHHPLSPPTRLRVWAEWRYGRAVRALARVAVLQGRPRQALMVDRNYRSVTCHLPNPPQAKYPILQAATAWPPPGL